MRLVRPAAVILFLLLALSALDGPRTSFAATFSVNTTNDLDDGSCNVAHCSLREAINASNANAGSDKIAFSIPGPAPHTIVINESPVLTGPVDIDGTTQPGYSSVPLVIIQGGPGGYMGPEFDATASGSRLAGLSIIGFDPYGVYIHDATNLTIEDNYIGLYDDGTSVIAFWARGAIAQSGGAFNLFDGNTIVGYIFCLALANTSGNVVINNRIGTGPSGEPLSKGCGTNSYGFSGSDVYLGDASDNVIGRVGQGNLLSYAQDYPLPGGIAGGRGVEVLGSSAGNSIRGNSIVNNSQLGIDLGPAGSGNGDGVTPNDSMDVDMGPNGLQNFPLNTAGSVRNGSGVTITANLKSAPFSPYAIDVYGADTCDASGYGEGATYLGSTTAVTDGTGNASFVVTVPISGRDTTMTATDAAGNTSEFSQCTSNGPPHLPCNGDFDCDLILDPVDVCPDLSDHDQHNSNKNFIDNSPPYAPSIDDKTLIISDPDGDVCDPDNDNDGTLDGLEFDGCDGFGILDPTLADTDGDRYVDPAECAIGSDPTDLNEHPSGALCAAFIGVSLSTDTDGDRIKDGAEFCNYGSNRLSLDTDGDAAIDGAKDGCEVASFNADRIVNSLDQGMLAQGIIGVVMYTPNIDINKDGVLNSIDQGLQATLIIPQGQCP